MESWSLIDYRMNRAIILPFKVVLFLQLEIEVGRTDDIERKAAELLMCGARLRLVEIQQLGKSLDEASPPELMLIRRNRVQHSGRRIIIQFFGEVFAEVAPQRHLRRRHEHRIERHAGAYDGQPAAIH
jgi:hypothetical protein